MVWVTPGGKPAGFTVAPVTLPSIAYLISLAAVINCPLQNVESSDPGRETKEILGEGGTTKVSEYSGAPQPFVFALTVTEPKKPAVHDITPVVQFIVPANVLSIDHVTSF